MADAILDQNHVKSRLGVLFSDGVTLVPITINPSNNGVMVNTVDSVDPAILALYAAGKAIPRDSNGTPALCAQSDADATVTFPVFVDATGAILVDL